MGALTRQEESQLRIDREAKACEDMDRFRAALLLAGFKVKRVHRLVNGYWGWSTEVALPWYLFETDVGLIEMGWRKRVISVDWQSTGVQWVRPVDPEVTNGPTFFHAWGYPKLLEYLGLLHAALLDNSKPSVV